MVLTLTIASSGGGSSTASETAAGASLTIHDGDTISFTGAGANALKSVRLEEGTDGTNYPTLISTVTANTDGSFSFPPIPLGYPAPASIYYRAHCLTT
jgi:hypothetical protein